MNVIERLLSWFMSIFIKRKYEEPKREVEDTKTKYKGYCDLCKTKKKFPDYFYCKYCNKYHCDKHRLPEQHKCPNPKSPYIKWRK